ncbi:hypothetical protein SASPL_133772 [Salvia splendens]|uniref:Mlo protein n=1 Tax=Salvia splendens TaxID=180675 RepID=A0A8X8X5P4_SALSN|nr:hypothetical protein SASPL_133772 [Salvia splendens]
MAAGSGDRSLEETSTCVAVVCAVFVVISIGIEHLIESFEKWFKKREKLEKIKAELMLLGFISLLLTVGTSYVAKICVPKDLGNKWLPCDKEDTDDHDNNGDERKNEHRRLLSYGEEMVWLRALASGTDQCCSFYVVASFAGYANSLQ